MTSPVVPLHSAITKEQFASYLNQYPAVVEAISRSKGAKDGQKTLAELDQYRYVDAVETFGLKKQKREMDLDDVKMLVEWKLRHGKFRPTLMSLVSSNPPSSSQQTIQFAIKFYASSKDAGSAIRMLSELKGVGPATASLLLSVHDADNVIFFSDEAYYWLCCGGKKESIKYTPKEYLALRAEADALMKRLGVSAVEVEKVAYVLMKQPETMKESKADVTAKTATPATSSSSKKRRTASSEGSDKKEKKSQVTAMKKDTTEENTALRRSKRLRK
ncbi:uncharacterized protein TRIREDRAFT_64358 [Trichoderma reesei QM6a]|uniref:Predicted protein n=2 Tax=Hypocrea jecorina TaxID=51453 RepID=G0RMR8_HYPJQ|nr:uncharacterized protein TRIREDRAFT_64358 [Trichoderma reesei QM6a]EGR47527.1 predicted protein [Trichoderma reesei QM6a]ETS00915.1 hypothetical protein M419DRAFT_9570 [Trichoderma reesei RUT C-30]